MLLPHHRLLLAPLLAGLLTASLLGCSVAVADPEATVLPTATAAADETADETADEPAAGDGAADAEELHPDAAAAREEARAAATTTLRCDGELVLDDEHTGQALVIDGDCDRLTVHMDAGSIVVGAVGTLLLTGAGNLIFTDTLQSLDVPGDINEVYWTGATPTVTNTGQGNHLKAG